MAQDKDSGDKTEQPTPKKLQDARKKGQVPKSRDLTSTVTLAVAAALTLVACGFGSGSGWDCGVFLDGQFRLRRNGSPTWP